jgi:rhamnosyltransferase subunit B
VRPIRRRIVVTTTGSLGDLHPYLALALRLRVDGHEVVIGTGECYRRKVEGLGLGFHAVRPDCAWVADPEAMGDISHPRWGTIRAIRMLLAVLRESYEDTLAAAEGADFLVANLVSYATRLVAEKRGLPWASVMHIPMGLFSATDPPLLPGFPTLSKRLRFLGPSFWGPLGRILNRAAGSSLANPLYRLRREIGLPPLSGENPLTEGHSPLLHLALFSKWLVDKQPDWPRQTVVTGFPWYEPDGHQSLPPELARFLDDGPPPVVFTLGSAVAAVAASFFEDSVKAVRKLGRRAVLIVNHEHNRPASLPPDVIACTYAPFTELFPRAAVVVHHGGIGTTGLAMRSGRPMLVVPHAWDQPDNAERAARLGIARTLPRDQYRPGRVAAELRRLLEDPRYARHAAQVGEQVRREDGVRVACEALGPFLRRQ